jgi:hypothetical protein
MPAFLMQDGGSTSDVMPQAAGVTLYITLTFATCNGVLAQGGLMLLWFCLCSLQRFHYCQQENVLRG